MFRHCRVLLIVVVSSGILAAAGCGSSPKLYPVTGTVKFSDGTIPQGQMSTVTFMPAGGGQTVKGASGEIQPDGSFRLMTFKPNDGALAGKYQVIVTVIEGYPQPKSLIDEKFTKAATTPLAATVKAGEKNDFAFVVEKPNS